MRKERGQGQQYQQRPQKARYTKTSIKKKQQLIDLVLNKSFSVYKACKMLKMSNSTGKAVILNFQKYGVVLNRNNDVQYERALNQTESKSQANATDVKKEEPNNEEEPRLIQDKDRWQILQKMGVLSYSFPFAGYPIPFLVNFQQ